MIPEEGYDVKVWEDTWIPTTPARPAITVAPVMHPNMRVIDLINQASKNWDLGLLENYVNLDDIPLNLLKTEEEKEVLEPSITKLQAFAWKLKAPTKICHLIWQLLTGHVALYKFGPYQQLQQARCISSTKCLHKYGLPILEEKQYYRAITRHARNDKLFRGIYRDPLELVRYAESECQAWFDANEVVQPVVQDNNIENPQVMDSGGNIQLMGTRNFTRHESALHSEVEALRWALENMLQHSTCQSFGIDCKELIAMIKEPHAWPSFATELERIETL
uniref:RNase H type-1 domain-containing protein n=1 Tax=Brassica oleracea var. oleracea TaxID=109376 RepID=A0A0D3DKG0_BRAOL